MKKLAWVIVIITIGSMAAQATTTLVTSGDISVAGNWSNGLPLIGNQGTIAPHGNAMLADTVSAGVIAWNFTSDWPKPTIQGETADGTDQWTDSVDEAAAPGSGTKVANSTDQYAVTTPVNAAMVTVFWESSNMWNGGAENNPDQGLYRVYLDDVGAGPMVTVFGLSAWLATVPGGATGYKLDFYRSTDLSGTTFAGLNIYDGTGTTDPLLESIAGGAVTGDGAYPTGSGSAGSRLKQSAVGTFTADTVTFNSVRGQGGGNRGCIAGFKITATTAGDPFLSFPMDSDPGWITEGDWAFGQPQGLSGDPSSGFTGANAYGYNLSGDYTNNIPQYWLTTSALDCSGHENVVLKFYRWLGVESATYDHAEIEISNDGSTWSTVWSHTGASLVDTFWREMLYDISAVADGEPTVYIRWGMGPTDSVVTYHGWNIDDVTLEGTILDDLVISPSDELASSGFEGGPFSPAQRVYTLSNNGSNTLSWIAGGSEAWVSVAPGSGTLAPAGTVDVMASINSNALSLLPDSYEDTVVFSNQLSGAAQIRGVVLEVVAIPGEIDVQDSIAPTNDLAMPFGDVIAGLSKTEQIIIHNTDLTRDLVISDISFGQYKEDFNDGLAQDWSEDLDSNWEVVSGEYRAQTSGTDFMVSRYAGEEWGDVAAQTTCRRVGNTGLSAALLLRATADFDPELAGSAYVFQVATDGSYSVWKQVGGSWSWLQEWANSLEIQPGSNVLMAMAEGNSLQFFINGTQVWSGTDSALSNGQIGLAGYSVAGDCTHYFDDVIAQEPVHSGSSISSEQVWYNTHSYGGGQPESAPENWTPEPYQGEPDEGTGNGPGMLVDLTGGSFALSNLPTFPHTLPPGKSLVVDATFAPGAVGSAEKEVSILSADLDEPEVLVSMAGTGIPDYLVATPEAAFETRGHPGGPFTPASKEYLLHNNSAAPLGWQASANEPWLSVSHTGGMLAAGATINVTVGLTPAADALPEGTYTDTVTFSNATTGIAHAREVKLTVFTTPEIHVSPAEGFVVTNAPGQVQKRTLVVSNDASADGHLDISVSTLETGRNEIPGVTAAGIRAPSPNHDFTQVAPGAEYKPRRLLVKFVQGIQSANQTASISSLGGTILRQYKLVPGLCLVELNEDTHVEESLVSFNGVAGIVYAQPDYVWHAESIPDDTRFDELWGMHNTGQTGGTPDADIDAPEAWGVTTGNSNVIVAVIDTGVDYTHQDLNENMWVNTGEIPGNGLDDDGNGFVDDIHGYDFVNGDGNPMDDAGHGTHCSGMIGAEGNNAEGVAGVCWDVRIMALKFLNSSGSGSTADAVSCIEYATLMGAKVMSNSWGGGGYDQALKDGIDAAGAQGIAFVAAAGNDGTDNDSIPHYPSNYESENVIAVLNSDHNDALSSSSSYGLISTDLAAPGSSILSCWPGGGYNSISGTSMATPHVAGACALMLSINPNLTAVEIKQVLMDTVDPTLPGVCASGGRMNLANAIAESGASWMNVYPRSASGMLPGGFANVTVYFDAAETLPGTYTGKVVVASNDPITPEVTIPVRMFVEPDNLIVLPAGAFEASGPEGGSFTPESTVYNLENSGTTTLDWELSGLPLWLDAFPTRGSLTAGAQASVLVSLNVTAEELPEGLYEDVLVFDNITSGMGKPRDVHLDISPRSRTVFYEMPLDSDPGWATEGQWAFGQPQGEGSHGMDPTSGYTGTKAYGYNLSGDYANNIPRYWLTTMALDCSAYKNVTLHFHRWLGVEYSDFDHADIEVSNDGSSWYGVWSHTGNSISDTAWQEVGYDISAVADGESTVYIRWGMGPTDGADTYPGWNIDDVSLEGLPRPQMLDHFTWDSIDSAQVIDEPIPVHISAKDAYGDVVSAFSGSIGMVGYAGFGLGSSILITEANHGAPDAIEFVNVGTWAVDVSGWQIFIYDNAGGWPIPLPVFTLPSGSLCLPGQVFTLTEYGTTPGAYPDFYTGANINWTSTSLAAVLLRDNTGELVDFMCVGSADPGQISHPVSIPVAEWAGPPVPVVADVTTYQRQGDADNNDSSDWTGLATGIGTINPGLTVPFAGGIYSVSIAPSNTGNFVNGVWSGTVSVLEATTNMVLFADDGTGHTGESVLFDVGLDMDGDRIPDVWEILYFGHSSNCVWSADGDHDGQNNLQEFIAGTNPTNAASFFAVTGFEPMGGAAGFAIEWRSVSGRVYNAYWSTNLLTDFHPMGGDIDYPQNSYTDTVHITEDECFYEVEVRMK